MEKMWAPEEAAAYWVNRASRLMVGQFDRALRPVGLAMSYLPVLRALADGEAWTQAKLAERAGVEQPSMAETLARMERDGMVRRVANPLDRRGSLVTLGRVSRARFPRARQALVECDERAMAGLSDAEKLTLRELCKRVVHNLEAVAAQAPCATPARQQRPRARPTTTARTAKAQPAKAQPNSARKRRIR